MSLDFAPLLKHVPFMEHLWRHFAEQVDFFPYVTMTLKINFNFLMLFFDTKGVK